MICTIFEFDVILLISVIPVCGSVRRSEVWLDTELPINLPECMVATE